MKKKKHPTQKSKQHIPLGMGIGLTAGLMGILLGGINKMLGLYGDEKTPQKLAEEMMAGAIRGILDHFDWKMDELKRNNERLIEEKAKIEYERDTLKSKYEKEEKK